MRPAVAGMAARAARRRAAAPAPRGRRRRRAAACCASPAPPARRSPPADAQIGAARPPAAACGRPSAQHLRRPARGAPTRAAAAAPSSCASQSAPVRAKAQSASKRTSNGKHRDLDAGGAPVVAEQEVAAASARSSMAPAVPTPQRRLPRAAEVLHGRQRARSRGSRSSQDPSTRKRMLSPGCSSGGRVARRVEEGTSWCCRWCSSRSGPPRRRRRSAHRRSRPRRPGCSAPAPCAAASRCAGPCRRGSNSPDGCRARRPDRAARCGARRSRSTERPVCATTSAMCGPPSPP